MLDFSVFGCGSWYIYINDTDSVTVCGYSASWWQFSNNGDRDVLLSQDGCPTLYISNFNVGYVSSYST